MTAKPAHSLYGVPATRDSRPAGAPEGSRPASASGPYIGRNRCIANNDTCEGPKAKDTDYCVGHLRSMSKKETE
jgi:hypothetical protein